MKRVLRWSTALLVIAPALIADVMHGAESNYPVRPVRMIVPFPPGGANDIVHVPYKGGGPALAAVIAGEVQVTFSNLSVALPQVRAGKLKGIAVTSARRANALPELPTVAESGLPDFEATAWVGIVAPAAVSRALVLRLNRDIHGVLADAEMRTQLLSRGLEPSPTTPEEFARHIRTDIERWSRVIRDSGIRAE